MNVAPNETYEAVVEWGQTGRTIGMRVLDNAGATTVGRLTGFTEYPAGSGVYYRDGNVAPAAQGQYTLLYDDDGGVGAPAHVSTDDLFVLFSSPGTTAPSGRDLCSLTDVCALVPGYNAGDDTDTDSLLQTLITEQSRDVMERCGREVTPVTSGSSARLFDIDNAFLRRRKLKIGDAATVTAVELQDFQGNTTQTLASTDYTLLPRVREDWQPYGAVWFIPTTPALWPTFWGGGWPISYGVVKVTGTWGFPNIPTTLREATARLVIVRYLNDVTSLGTQFANAADRNEFNVAASIRTALDAIDRFYVPTI